MNLWVPDKLVADREALERRDPGLDAALAEAVVAASADDAGRLRRDPKPFGIGQRHD